MNGHKRMEVLVRIRQAVGDLEHFKERTGAKETARQIGIWYQVRKYLQNKGSDVTAVDAKIHALLARYKDIADLLIVFGEFSEQEYLFNLQSGNYLDDGSSYLDWTLKSFGERLYVYDS